MDSETTVGGVDLSPRAGIAMLTLQVRATLQEAAAMEAQYVPIDHAAARQQLLEKLTPLIEEREHGFEAELTAARADAASIVARARDAAASITAERIAAREAERVENERLAAEAAEAERLEIERLAAEAAEAERLEVERLAAEAAEAERLENERLAAEAAEAERLEAKRIATERLEVARLALAANAAAQFVVPAIEEADTVDSVEDWSAFAPTAEPSSAEPSKDGPAPTEVLQPSQVTPPPAIAATASNLPVIASNQAPVNVTIDAEAFARVFATVFASLIEHRLVDQPTQMYMRPMMMEAPAAAPAPQRQGFWSQARHPDVLLMGLATAIVLVVLAAWLV